MAADRQRGTNYHKQGGMLSRLIATWQPLLTSAVADEQRCIRESSSKAAGGRKDRPNYGPYLVLLEPEDLAHITLQSE